MPSFGQLGPSLTTHLRGRKSIHTQISREIVKSTFLPRPSFLDMADHCILGKDKTSLQLQHCSSHPRAPFLQNLKMPKADSEDSGREQKDSFVGCDPGSNGRMEAAGNHRVSPRPGQSEACPHGASRAA